MSHPLAIIFAMEKETAAEVFAKLEAKFPTKAKAVLLDLFEEYFKAMQAEGNPFARPYLQFVEERRAEMKKTGDAFWSAIQQMRSDEDAHIARGEVWKNGQWEKKAPMVFGLTHGFTYLGGFDVSRDVREYGRGCYEMECPVCGAARKDSVRSYEPVDATLYSCFKCRVLWGDESLILDFSVPTPEEITKYRLPNPWVTRG